MTTILIYWVLPSLVTFLLMSVSSRRQNKPLFNTDRNGDQLYDFVVIVACILYPVIFVLFLWGTIEYFKVGKALANFGRALTKERSFRG